MNEVESQMNNLNVKSEQEKEYTNNKLKNQNSYGYNTTADKTENNV
jgi:hypothetical protein